MEFSEVLDNRRTYRDYSDREVSDEILDKVISAAFKAPTNDHLRQFEFVVVRGRENIAKVIAPLAKNMAAFKDLVFEVDNTGDKDKMAMFADALPKQQRMLMQSGLLIIPFYNQKQSPLLHPVEQSSLNYFASAWCALENMLLAATEKGIGSLWICDIYFAYSELCEWLNSDGQLIAAIAFGYPNEFPKERPRKKLDGILEWRN